MKFMSSKSGKSVVRNDLKPPHHQASSPQYLSFLDGGGEISAAIRAYDWDNSPVGSLRTWPQSLRTYLNLMLSSASPIFIWWDRNELINFHNDALGTLLGDNHIRALGRPAHQAWHGLWEQLGPQVEKTLATGKPAVIKDVLLSRAQDGHDEEKLINISITALRDDGDTINGVICLVTEFNNEAVIYKTSQQELARHDEAIARKIAEEQLQESEKRFRNLADTAPMYIAMANKKGDAVYFNKPWLEFTGMRLKDMLGMGWLKTLHPEDAPKFKYDFQEAFAKQIPINKQYRFKRADGEYRWMLAVGSPRITPDGHFIGYYGTYTDVHELKEAQLAIQESEERFRTLANNISQLAWSTGPLGEAIWFNQRWYDYTGMKPEEMREGALWHKFQHPDYVAKVNRSFQSHLKSGKRWESSFPLKGSNGRYRWFLVQAVPVKDSNGNIVRWFGTNTDIDDLRRATKRKTDLETMTANLQKRQVELETLNQAKDEFISLASHQLRTPATGVKQYISMLVDEYAGPLNSSQREFAELAYQSNERQLNIINDLLSVAQIDAGKIRLHRKPANVVMILEDALKEQALKFSDRSQRLEFHSDFKECLVDLDENRIRMVLDNLIDNASKYTYPGGTIEVRLEKPKETSVKITIKDEGVGIDKSKQDTIFDKFVRVTNPLSATVGGTGLGLYLTKRIIELHNGSVRVQSTPNKGSSFIITLPINQDSKS